MWIRRNNVIINTDNVCAMRMEGDKLIFRLHGTSNPSTIERTPLSAEITMKNMPVDVMDLIWKGILSGERYLTLQ